MTNNEWVQPGARAVILQSERRGGLKAESVTIERALKRDLVLSNGERWNRNTLEMRTGTWSPSYRLVPEDDPRVAETRALIRQSAAEARAAAIYDEWRRVRTSENAAAVAEAFEKLAAL